MPTITRIPRTSADDGHWIESSSTLINNFSNFSTGNDGAGAVNGFIRFPANDESEELPVGATITAAYLTMEAHSTTSAATCRLLIRAVDEDNPAAPATYAGAEGATRTTASVSWTPGSVTDGVSYNSADFASVVQEIVDRAGWAADNAILIYVEDNGSDSGVQRQWRSQSGGPAPVLTVEYELDEEPEPEPGLLYRINCGNTYPTEGWESDEPYLVSGDQVYATVEAQDTSATLGCPEDVLRDHRWATPEQVQVGYQFDVTGYDSLTITLYFSEIYPGFVTEDRYFDIYVDGVQVATNYDVYEEAGGANTGVALVLNDIEPASTVLSITFLRQYRAPMVSGIVIEGELPPPPPPAPAPPPAPTGVPDFVVEIDANGDDRYSLDVSDDFIEGDWENGLTEPGQVIPHGVRANVVLRNTDGRYSPEHANAVAGLTRGRKLRIRTNYAGPNQPEGVYSRDVSSMGTLEGITSSESAPHFDPAQNDYVDLLAAGNLAQRFDGTHGTISMWIKADAGAWTDGEFRFVFSIETTGDPFPDILHAGKLTVANQFSVERWVQGKSTNHTWLPGATVGTDWWHLAVSWSETFNFTRVYFNGTLLDEDEIVASWLKPLAIFDIGARSLLSQHWDGGLSHFALYDAPLTHAEVAYLAAQRADQREAVRRVRPDALVAYYPLGEQSGTVARDESTVRTMWCGWIEDIRPTPGQYGERRTTIEAAGWLAKAQEAKGLQLPLRFDVESRTLLYNAVTSSGVYPPGRIMGTDIWYAVSRAWTRFPFAFDDVPENESLYSVMRRVVEGEGRPARLYQTRAGLMRFMNRHELATADGSAYTLDGTMRVMDYGYGSELYNRVLVDYVPRRVETDAEVYYLCVLDNSIRIDPGEVRSVRMRYTATNGKTISTTEPVDPVPGVHYHINTEADGSGDFVDTDPDWVLTATHYGTESEWVITNNSNVTGYLLGYSYQAGDNRLIAHARRQAEANDTTSQIEHGTQELTITATMLSDASQAWQYALHLLAMYREVRGNARRVTIMPARSAEDMEFVLNYGPDDQPHITVKEAQTGHIGDYYWIGEHWRVPSTAAGIEVDLLLESVGTVARWMLVGSGPRSLPDGTNLAAY